MMIINELYEALWRKKVASTGSATENTGSATENTGSATEEISSTTGSTVPEHVEGTVAVHVEDGTVVSTSSTTEKSDA